MPDLESRLREFRSVQIRDGSASETAMDYAEDLIDALVVETKSLRAALVELVALKDLKDAFGKTPDYEDRQPKAWEAARAALEKTQIAGSTEGQEE